MLVVMLGVVGTLSCITIYEMKDVTAADTHGTKRKELDEIEVQ